MHLLAAKNRPSHSDLIDLTIAGYADACNDSDGGCI